MHCTPVSPVDGALMKGTGGGYGCWGLGSVVDGRPSVVSVLGNEFARGYELRIVVGRCWAFGEEVVVESQSRSNRRKVFPAIWKLLAINDKRIILKDQTPPFK